MTTDNDRPTDTIRDAFEAMLAFLRLLMTPWQISAPAPKVAIEAAMHACLDPRGPEVTALRDLIQRAAEEHNRRTSAAAADMPAERLREMRERCERATPGPWAVRDEGREGIGIDRGGIDNIGSDRFILNEGANGTRADLEFAAHARTDLPAALAEIERLTAERSELRAIRNDAVRGLKDRIAALEAELAARAPAGASLEVRADMAEHEARAHHPGGCECRACLRLPPDVDASRPGLTEEQARAWERLRTAATTAVEAYEDSDADEAFEPLFAALDEALAGLATAEEESASRGETGPAAEPTRAERVAEAQRLRAEARAEAEACTVPMPADLLARYPRSADPPEPDRPTDLGPGIGGAPIRVRPTGAPDPRATLHAGDPASEAPKRGPSGVRVTGELDTPWGRLPILDLGEDKEPSR